MDIDKINKLLKSSNKEDKLIGITLLKGKTVENISKILDLETGYDTIGPHYEARIPMGELIEYYDCYCDLGNGVLLYLGVDGMLFRVKPHFNTDKTIKEL